MPTVQETIQETFWRGDFGLSYTERNKVNWRKRVPFFLDMLHLAKNPRSILEVGCNSGANLKALRAIVGDEFPLHGVDINQKAIQEAASAGLAIDDCSVFDLQKVFLSKFDLTLTVGVLIHIAPADLERAMQSIIAASQNYVLAVEYAADEETEIEYRGHAERLWKRPFGQLYVDLGLKMVAEGEAPADAFDRCNFWILKRP
jgi:pseudaminic acid biosynthesis-associated methylase